MGPVGKWIPRPRSVIGWLLVFAVAAGAWTSTWSSVPEFVREVDHGRGLFQDFVFRFHPVARDFLDTHKPYPGYYYSPTFAVLISPFGAAENPVRAWGALQIISSALLLIVPAAWLWRRSAGASWAYGLLLLTAMPFLHNFKWGQVSVPLALLTLGALLLYQGGRRAPAAACLALAATVKFYPGIYALYFLLRRDFRFLAWLAGFGLLFGAGLPWVVLGTDGTLLFYRTVADNLAYDQGKMSLGINSQFLPHVVERWTLLAGGEAAPIPPDPTPLRTAMKVVSRGLFLVVAARLAWVLRRRTEPVAAFAVLSASIPLLVPSSWPHYFVFLPFFQVWAWRRVPRLAGPGWLWTALLLFSMLATSLAGFRIIGDWRTYAYAGVPLLASLPFLILCWVPGFWDEETEEPA